jgi:hypothetical protein
MNATTQTRHPLDYLAPLQAQVHEAELAAIRTANAHGWGSSQAQDAYKLVRRLHLRLVEKTADVFVTLRDRARQLPLDSAAHAQAVRDENNASDLLWGAVAAAYGSGDGRGLDSWLREVAAAERRAAGKDGD